MKVIDQGYFEVSTQKDLFGFRVRPFGKGAYIFIGINKKVVSVTLEELLGRADAMEEAWNVHSSPIRFFMQIDINLSQVRDARLEVFTYSDHTVNVQIQFLEDPTEDLPEVKDSKTCRFDDEAQVRAFVNAVRFFCARYKTSYEEKGDEQ